MSGSGGVQEFIRTLGASPLPVVVAALESHRLAANLGAPWLARTALDSWLTEAAATVSGSEVHWQGGGNAMVETPSLDDARNVATRFSVRVLNEAPGLSLVCTHEAWSQVRARGGVET